VSLSRGHGFPAPAAHVAAGAGALAADALPGVPPTTGDATAGAAAPPGGPPATGDATAGAAPARRVQCATGDRAAAAPRVRQMVLFRDGHALTKRVSSAAATAGAADPSGPFGSGRLRSGQRITWFYCVQATDCQRTLELRATPVSGGVVATVRAYDDAGDGVPVEGARVSGGGTSGLTAADGRVELALAPGTHRLVARKDGLVRSFAEIVEVP
jgi:hypothetical protein